MRNESIAGGQSNEEGKAAIAVVVIKDKVIPVLGERNNQSNQQKEPRFDRETDSNTSHLQPKLRYAMHDWNRKRAKQSAVKQGG